MRSWVIVGLRRTAMASSDVADVLGRAREASGEAGEDGMDGLVIRANLSSAGAAITAAATGGRAVPPAPAPPRVKPKGMAREVYALLDRSQLPSMVRSVHACSYRGICSGCF